MKKNFFFSSMSFMKNKRIEQTSMASLAIHETIAELNDDHQVTGEAFRAVSPFLIDGATHLCFSKVVYE